MPDLRPASNAGTDVADWLELLALVRGVALGIDELTELALASGARQADLSIALQTMRSRMQILGTLYPYRVANGVAARPNAADHPYVTLLLLSPPSPVRRLEPLSATALHLEQVTAAAMSGLFGDRTRVVRFGWPSDEGRPPEFPDAIRWLAKEMGVEIGAAYRPPYRKDGGVDVVAWRPFEDGRPGFPVMLTQCTLEDRYDHKAGDVDLRVWAGWLRLDTPPLTALAVPSVVPHGERWNALSARTMVFDRVRLSSLVAHDSTPRLAASSAWTRNWVTELSQDQ